MDVRMIKETDEHRLELAGNYYLLNHITNHIEQCRIIFFKPGTIEIVNVHYNILFLEVVNNIKDIIYTGHQIEPVKITNCLA